MAIVSLEERVAALEAEVAQLKQARQGVTKMPLPWWERRFGAFKDDPLYDEAMRLVVWKGRAGVHDSRGTPRWQRHKDFYFSYQ